MSGLIGKKIGMTSVYSAEGKNIPCTVIEAGPCVVTQIKTVEKDTYEEMCIRDSIYIVIPKKCVPLQSILDNGGRFFNN